MNNPVFSPAQLLEDFVARQNAPVWALIDGVNCKELPNFARNCVGGSLYKASAKAEPAHSPWLLKLEQGSPRIEDMSLLPPDTHWGFLFSSDRPFEVLRAHFRKFTMMWIDDRPDADQAPVYFRFYDPRVLMDCFQAMTPEHLAALLSPVRSLALPLSPLLGPSTGLSPLAPRASFRGQVIAADCAATAGADAAGFRISAVEYGRFSSAQQVRARRKLARELQGMFPDAHPERLIAVAEQAPAAAAAHGLESVRQARLYAECMILYGADFDRRDPQARAVLMQRDALAWRKAEALADWKDGKAHAMQERW